MSYEESVSYFKRLENLEKIRRTDGPGPATLLVDKKKRVSVNSNNVGKYSNNSKESNMWCHYCNKILEQFPSSNNRKRLALKPKMNPERSLWSSFPKKSMHPKGNLSLKRLQEERKTSIKEG
jgi:hypothetical protein